MRITKFNILSYGPIRSTGEINLEQLNLIFGKNEEGKTLLVDALLKKLFNTEKIRLFDNADRVPEMPEALLEIQYFDGGNESKLSDLTKLKKDKKISIEDARNIFVIRNSDLNFHEKDSYYQNLTQRLTNANIDLVKKIQRRVIEICNVTSGRNHKETTRELLKQIERLNEKINDILVSAVKQNFKELSQSVNNMRNKLEYNQHLLKDIELLEKKNLYLEAKKIYEEYKSLKSDIEKFPDNLSQDEATVVFDKEQKLKTAEAKIPEIKQEINFLTQRLEELKQKIKDLEQKKHELENKRNYKIQNEQKLQDAKHKFAEVSITSYSLFSFLPLILGAILLLPSIIVALIKFHLLLIPTLVAGGGLTVLGLFKYLHKLKTLSNINRLLLDAEAYGLQARDLKELLQTLNNITHDLQRIEAELEDLKEEKAKTGQKIEQKEKELKEHEANIKEAQSILAKIKYEEGISNYSQYQEKLESYNKLKNRLENLKTRLDTLLSETDEDKWEILINNYKQYADTDIKPLPPDIHKDKIMIDIENLRKKIKETEETITRVKDDIRLINLELQTVVEKANNEISFMLNVHFSKIKISTIDDLYLAKDVLNNISQNLAKQKKVASITCDLLGQINKEKEQTVEKLFSPETNVSKYFKEITNGRYVDVKYDSETKKIIAVTNLGEEIEAEKLSGGTLDQLYFAIRLALAEKLLDQPGFFILDDPFLKYDLTRLENQFKLLNRIVQNGWQVIYFSAKDEIKNLFQKQKCKIIEAPGLQT